MKNFLHPVAAALAAAALLTACAAPKAPPITLNLVALNDFHGNLEAHKFTSTGVNDKEPVTIQAGGIDTIGAALAAWRRDDPQLLFVGAGDLVGASPALSSMWADEPSVAALSMLGMNISSVGNHEFDPGRVELLRQQNGGCVSPRPEKACKLGAAFEGAGFQYLAANVVDTLTGQPLLPAYRIEERKGVKIAFIGAVLHDTAAMVLASGIAGLSFGDEADAINRAVDKARSEGATVFIVLIHEGGGTDEPYDKVGCEHLKGPIVSISKRLDPAVRLIVSGHTHKGFLCKVDGRTITQAEMGGHLLTRIGLSVDPATHAVTDIRVQNVVMRAGDYPPLPAMTAYLTELRARSAAALSRPVARVAVRSIIRKSNSAGENALGDLVADGVLGATIGQGSQIGFMNTGGLRQDFEVGENMMATYGQAQVVLPFGNTLVLMDMTGAQLRQVLEEQWLRAHPDSPASILQISQGFTYRWDAAAPKGARIVKGSMMLNGAPIDEKRIYRVTVNNFLAEGGDSFPSFAAAVNKVDTQIHDIEAFVGILTRQDHNGTPVANAAPAARILRDH